MIRALKTLTVKETARLIGMNKDVLSSLIKSNQMPEIGKCVKYKRNGKTMTSFIIYETDVKKFIEEHSNE